MNVENIWGGSQLFPENQIHIEKQSRKKSAMAGYI